MKKNFVEELRWRGMVHDMMPGAEEQFKKEMTTAYLGIDPTADSLHIGHLVGVMILKHLQMCGHKPIALIGGATGMIGDPSGKSQERNLLDEATLRHNQNAIKAQLSRLIDFNSDAPNAAIMVNNYDWMKEFSFLDFVRTVGKLITVNYMMAKDSVKKRFSGEGDGMSFTEFTYQLLQGYDFLHLYQTQNCKIQLGGSDQWGNITTGTELIRRSLGSEAEAWGMTCPLIKKADGTKFGKTESGNIWLDARYTSPYKFYQFWLNVSDEDAKSYIKIFTLLDKAAIDALIAEHDAAPHLRALQKALAKEITIAIHSEQEYPKAVDASSILFSKPAKEDFERLDEQTIEQIYDGETNIEVARGEFIGVNFVDAATQHGIFESKREARELIGAGAVAVSCRTASADMVLAEGDIIKGRFITIKKGKKKNILIKLTMLTLPKGYRDILGGVENTEKAIKHVKDMFQDNLSAQLTLLRVTAPMVVLKNTGINDDLNSVERPVSFPIKDMNEAPAEVVHSLAKWKRLKLGDMGTAAGRGIYTDMNALRPDEELDNIHSIYVDQWDWEKVITADQRNLQFLRQMVRRIYESIKVTENKLYVEFAELVPQLPEDIFFISAQELLDLYPSLSPKERENEIVRKHGAVFVMGIGHPLSNGESHDGRAADYDDWSTPNEEGFRGLNGDILLWNPILESAFEVSSMGIRVDAPALEYQLEMRGQNHKRELYFHRRLLEGSLPLTIGGGIGQSRLCMFLLRKAHIGEIQSSLWSEDMRETCRKAGITLI